MQPARKQERRLADPVVAEQQSEDAALVVRAKQGDRAAFEQLAQRHARRVFGLILRMLRGDREEAEDLAQDVWLSAYKGLAGFREESQFGTWVHRIAVNKTLNRLQKKVLPSRPLVNTNPEGDESTMDIPDTGETPEMAAQRHELQRAVVKALDKLSDTLRQVFVLRELHHMSHEEIAEMLGSNPQAIRVRLHRAKKELVSQLGPYLGAA